MMSEEEKKAIERFKSKIKRADVDVLKFSDVYTTLDIHNLRLLLNLIEKLEKELEQEKEKRKEALNYMYDLLNEDYPNVGTSDINNLIGILEG